MVKTIVGVVMILLAAGGWFYLDHLNKEELAAAAEMRKVVENNRALAIAAEKAKVEARAQFETQISADLKSCKEVAENANTEFLTQHQLPVRRKPGQFTIPPEATEEAAKTLDAAHAECQSIYDKRLAIGM